MSIPHQEIYPNVPLVYPHSSIRLLKIEPGWPGDLIRVSLIAIKERHATPPYEALSYTWGDANITESIKCNGIDINVTVSLANAVRVLRQLPAQGDLYENLVPVITESALLHSSNRSWKGIARNINETGVVETRREGQPGPEKLFWIDALCINQTDPPECSAQVGTMRDIYTRAERVRIFLGKDLLGARQEIFTPIQLAEPVTRKIDKTLPKITIKELGVEPLVLMFIVQALRNGDRMELNDAGIKIVVEKGFPDVESKEWIALQAFFKLPWFSRVWIIQEIVLAKEATLILGDWEIDWDPFSRAVEILDATNLPIPHHVKLNSTPKEQWTGFDVSLSHYLGNIRQTPGKSKALYPLLVDALERGSTNPRDHVYALLGITSELVDADNPAVHKELLKVDYKKSVADVFRDATRFIMFNLNTVRFLARAQLTEKSIELGGPSWVPNWAEPGSCFPFLAQFFDANLKQPGFTTKCNDEPDVLLVPAHRVGRVANITDILAGDWKGWHYPPLQGETDFLNASWKLASQCLASQDSGRKYEPSLFQPTYYQSQDMASQAFMYTLVANHDDESASGRADGDVGMVNSGRPWLKKYAEAFMPPSSGFRKFRNMVKDVVVAPEGVLFQAAFMRASVGRRFFITEQGLMGIGPASLEAGDEVMVVLGVSIPMVLRPASKQEVEGSLHNYVVVGECYVHGIMDGEVIRYHRERAVQPDTIRLV